MGFVNVEGLDPPDPDPDPEPLPALTAPGVALLAILLAAAGLAVRRRR